MGMSVPGGAASREPMPPGGAWWSGPSSPSNAQAKFGGTVDLRLRLADRAVPQGRSENTTLQELNWVLCVFKFSKNSIFSHSYVYICFEVRYALSPKIPLPGLWGCSGIKGHTGLVCFLLVGW